MNFDKQSLDNLDSSFCKNPNAQKVPTLGSTFKYKKDESENSQYREIKLTESIIEIRQNNADIVYYITNIINNQEENIIMLYEEDDQLKIKSNLFSIDDLLESQ